MGKDKTENNSQIPGISQVCPLIVYDKPPEGNFKKIGIYYYNEDWSGLAWDLSGVDNENVLKQSTRPTELSSIKPGSVLPAHRLELTPSDFQLFKEMTDKALQKQAPTKEDLRVFEKSFSVVGARDDQRPVVYTPLPENKSILFQWVYYVWRGSINVRRCKAEDCDKIFIPVRSDQQYCSKRCANRVWAQKHLLGG